MRLNLNLMSRYLFTEEELNFELRNFQKPRALNPPVATMNLNNKRDYVEQMDTDDEESPQPTKKRLLGYTHDLCNKTWVNRCWHTEGAYTKALSTAIAGDKLADIVCITPATNKNQGLNQNSVFDYAKQLNKDEYFLDLNSAVTPQRYKGLETHPKFDHFDPDSGVPLDSQGFPILSNQELLKWEQKNKKSKKWSLKHRKVPKLNKPKVNHILGQNLKIATKKSSLYGQRQKGRQLSKKAFDSLDRRKAFLHLNYDQSTDQIVKQFFQKFFKELKLVTRLIENDRLQEYYEFTSLTYISESLVEIQDLKNHPTPLHHGMYSFGTNAVKTGSVMPVMRTVAITALDLATSAIVISAAFEASELFLLGKQYPFFQTLEETQKINLNPHPVHGIDHRNFTCLFGVDNFLEIFYFLDKFSDETQRKVKQLFLPCWNNVLTYLTVKNMEDSLAISSIKKYYNHLNRITEYYVWVDHLNDNPPFEYTKEWVLDQIQEGKITPHNLSEIIHWLKTGRGLKPSSILNIHGGWTFFFKHLTHEIIRDNYLYEASYATLKKTRWFVSNECFPIMANQIFKLIEITEPTKEYENLSPIIELATFFITRPSETRLSRFNDYFTLPGRNRVPGQLFGMHIKKQKNHLGPKTKICNLCYKGRLRPLRALEKLRKCAKSSHKISGYVCIDLLGKHYTDNRLRELLKKAMNALRQIYQELLLAKLSWYSIRSGWLIFLFTAGLSEPEIKAISLHAPSSDVLKQSYIGKLRHLHSPFIKTIFDNLEYYANLQLQVPRSMIRQIAESQVQKCGPLLKQIKKDVIKAAQVVNLLQNKLNKIDKRKITPKILEKECSGDLKKVNLNESFQSEPCTPPIEDFPSDEESSSEPDSMAIELPTKKYLSKEITDLYPSDSSSDDELILNMLKKPKKKRLENRKFHTPTIKTLQNPVDQIDFDKLYDLAPKSTDYENLIVNLMQEFEETGFFQIEDEEEKNQMFTEFVKKWTPLTGKNSKSIFENLWKQTFKYIQTY